MLINTIRLLITLLTATPAFAATGSNLGQYATHFSPAVLTGQVTDSAGNPVSGAIVSTIAGHTTTTDANGNYTLALDAPGIYVVTTASGATTTTNTVDITLGTTIALNPVFPVVIPPVIPPTTPPGIPTLPQWGMILMTLALLTLAT